MVRVFVAGHRGMVGSAICKQLVFTNVEVVTVSRDELDLTDQAQAEAFFKVNKFDQVYLAAAKVGGIHANSTYPAEFIYQNLMIQNNVIHQSYKTGVKKLLFLGSSCIYPRLAEQPMGEKQLLSGLLEPTNEPYAIAKIAGIKMCESYNRQYSTDYRSVMPTNLYGPNDNFHPENSHVIPALIRRFHDAMKTNSPEVTIWGTGISKREFLHVDDMARASVFIMNLEKNTYAHAVCAQRSHINIGSGIDCSIKELAEKISTIVGYNGEIMWDETKPDGAPRKLMDVRLAKKLGWKYKVDLRDGLAETYAWYVKYIQENDVLNEI